MTDNDALPNDTLPNDTLSIDTLRDLVACPVPTVEDDDDPNEIGDPGSRRGALILELLTAEPSAWVAASVWLASLARDYGCNGVEPEHLLGFDRPTTVGSVRALRRVLDQSFSPPPPPAWTERYPTRADYERALADHDRVCKRARTVFETNAGLARRQALEAAGATAWRWTAGQLSCTNRADDATNPDNPADEDPLDGSGPKAPSVTELVEHYGCSCVHSHANSHPALADDMPLAEQLQVSFTDSSGSKITFTCRPGPTAARIDEIQSELETAAKKIADSRQSWQADLTDADAVLALSPDATGAMSATEWGTHEGRLRRARLFSLRRDRPPVLAHTTNQLTCGALLEPVIS